MLLALGMGYSPSHMENPITRKYLEQRREELAVQQKQAHEQAERSRAAAMQLGGSIVQINELLAMLPEEAPPATP